MSCLDFLNYIFLIIYLFIYLFCRITESVPSLNVFATEFVPVSFQVSSQKLGKKNRLLNS